MESFITKYKYVILIATALLLGSMGCLLLPKTEYNAKIKITLEKSLDDKTENSQIVVNLRSLEDKLENNRCKNKPNIKSYTTRVNCAKVLLKNSEREYELENIDNGFYGIKNIEEGDYQLYIDADDDGNFEGATDISIRKNLRLISPGPEENIEEYAFNLKWDERNKDDFDEIFRQLEKNGERTGEIARYYVA